MYCMVIPHCDLQEGASLFVCSLVRLKFDSVSECVPYTAFLGNDGLHNVSCLSTNANWIRKSGKLCELVLRLLTCECVWVCEAKNPSAFPLSSLIFSSIRYFLLCSSGGYIQQNVSHCCTWRSAVGVSAAYGCPHFLPVGSEACSGNSALCAGMWLFREVNNPIGKLAWPLINSRCLCEKTMAGKPKTLFNSGGLISAQPNWAFRLLRSSPLSVIFRPWCCLSSSY